MNFIIKSVLKKIFTQYLFIEDEGLDLTSGVIKLPLGNINQNRINEKLLPLALRIHSSSYKNLIIHLPIVELMSKPIRISIEVLDIVIHRLYDDQSPSRKDSEESNEPTKSVSPPQAVEEKEGGYLRNIINRLLYNMEICMDRINIRLIDEREEEEFREAYFTLHNFRLKNSLVILQANIIKKTLTMDQLHLRHAIGELIVKDLSLCLDFSHRKLHLIAVGSTIRLNIFKIPFNIILKNLNKKQAVPQRESKRQSQIEEMSVFVKLSTVQVSFRLVQAEVTSIEFKAKNNQKGMEMSVNLTEIKCCNVGRERQESHLVRVGYLPFSRLVKINSEFEDSAIKHCCFILKHQAGQTPSIHTRLYHLAININVDQCKDLLDKLITKDKEIDKAKAIFAKITQQSPTLPQKQRGRCFVDALLYRALLGVQYGSSKVEVFGSCLLQVKEESPREIQLKRLNSSREKSRQVDKQGELVTLVKVYQLGVRAFGCNLIEVVDLQGKMSGKEIIVNANSIISQISLSCLDSIAHQATIVQRDIAYYQQKFTNILPPSNQKPNDDDQQMALSITHKIYIKVDETVISIGELIEVSSSEPSEDRFVSIIDAEISKLLFSLVSGRIKTNAQVIIFISSPYTLQRTPLTNELQFQLALGLSNSELSLSFKNKLVFLIQDHYFNIVYKLLDRRDVWCTVRNLTNETLTLLQETSQDYSIFGDKPAEGEMGMEEDTWRYKTMIGACSNKHMFWIGDDQFKILMKGRLSKPVSVKMVGAELNAKSERFCYSLAKQLVFSEDKHYDYVLKLEYNKLGNLCQISVDYKALITSFCRNYTFRIGNSSFEVRSSRREKWMWFQQLEDLTEDFEHYQLISEERVLRLEQLMAHEQFSIIGIYQQIEARRLYDGYIYQSKAGNQLKYSIMPLLIIINTCNEDFQLEIIDKKSAERQIIALKSQQSCEVGHNGKFDYYLKQFTIKISLISKEEVTYQSQSLYFNTFFMVDHKTETNVQLRSTQKHNYSKKSLVFEESLLLKTKTITLRSSLHINNFTDFSFTLQARDASKSHSERMDVDSHSSGEWTHRIKEDSLLQFWINKSVESKVQARFGELKEMKLLSFNFCKIQDRFFNVFIRAERRNIDGIETIVMDHFIEIINLTTYIGPVKLQHFNEFESGVRTNLPLNSTSLNKYNNKTIELDDIGKIYAQIFLTAKVTDVPLSLMMGEECIKFEELLKESSQELQIGRSKFIITLLKDMTNNKITFYLADRLFNQKLHYTVFNNQTKTHFLLTDDFEYAPHFSNTEHNCSNTPEKVLIAHHSFNCLINRENYDLLLCDKFETHLEKIDKRVLQKEGIKLQQYNFDAITLFDCVNEGEKSVRRQFTSKQVEIRVRMYGKMELSVSLQALTLRLLEAGKLDCLIQDISIKNEESKDHLLRIPEQTYLLIEGKMLENGYFILIKNLFVKCKNVIVNIKRQMPYSLIELITTLSERLALNIEQAEPAEQADPRRYRENIKKLNGETKLRNHIKEPLLLIRNLYIHEIHLSLTIELENLSFSNVIILPFYELEGKFERMKSFTDNLTNFYFTTLLAKFPKLSFLMSNFRSPLNTLRLFFNVREALRIKVDNEPIIHFRHPSFSANPFHFSMQRWNLINSTMVLSEKRGQDLVAFLFQGRKCLIVSSVRVYWLEEQWVSWALRDLEGLRICKSRVNSELLLKFKGGDQLNLIEEHKKCIKLLNHIEKLLL